MIRFVSCAFGSLFFLAACGDDPVSSSDADVDAMVVDGSALAPCAPESCGPYWVEEGDELRFDVSCSEHPECATSELRIEPLPDGASFDAETGIFAWTPGLDQAAVWQLELVSGASGERAPITIGVADRFDDPDNVPVADLAGYTHELGLPVIHVTWHSDDPSYCLDATRRDPVPADILVGGHLYDGAEMRCRGATSLGFPKKSFSLRFTKEDPFVGEGSLARFGGRRRLVATQTLDDSSQIRTRLAFELWNRLDPEHIRLEQAAAVVYVDGEYHGLYQLTDDVGDHLVAAQGLNKDGNLYKAENHDANLRATTNAGARKNPVWSGYEKDEGEPADDFTDLAELLEWVSDSSDEDFEAGIDARLRTEDFIDWYVLATTIMAGDSYGKNSYLYHDPDDASSLWRYAPWDMNESFGQNWASSRVAANAQGRLAAIPLSANGVWERIAGIPGLLARLDARYADALDGPMSAAEVVALIDEMASEIAPSARRDDRKWDAARRAYPLWSGRTDFQRFDAEIAYVREWTTDRWAFVEGW